MQYIRTKSQCRLCPLRDRPRVWSERPASGARIAILTEAPGEAEEAKGRPLIGPSGGLFHAVLKRLDIARQGLWIANTLCCKVPGNDVKGFEGADALTCCAAGLREELLAMKAAGVRVIAAMGDTAVRALGLEGSVTTIRGSVYNVAGMHVVPMYHPAYVLRAAGAKKDGTRTSMAAFQCDLATVKDIAENGYKPYREDFNLEPTLADVEAFVADAVAHKRLIAVDVETDGLKWARGTRVVVCGLASSATKAIVVPFLKEHRFPYWHNGDEAKARAALQRLFDVCPLVLQNCFFDIPMLRNAEGFKIDDARILHDTLLLHSLIAPEAPHNLSFIASTYRKGQEWKEWFRDRDKTIFEIDQIEMRRYNARDCAVLHQVLPAMLAHLHELDLDTFYAEETQRLVGPIMQMVERGVAFDVDRLDAFTRLLDKTIGEKREAAYAAFDLPKEFNLGSDEELRYFIYGVEPSKFRQLRGTLITYTKHLKKGDKKDEKFLQGVKIEDAKHDIPPEDVLSIDEVPSLGVRKPGSEAYEELRRVDVVARTCKSRYTLRGWEPLKTDSGKLGVGSEALLAYVIQLNNRLDTISKLAKPEAKADEVALIEDKIAFIEFLGELKELAKLKAAFTKYTIDPDGRIRASWKAWGTATGRMSCSQPNLEQLPNEGVGLEVRRFIKARPGWKLVSSDGENLEVALLGFDALDPVIIDIYVNKQNIHDLNTKILYEIDETHPLWKQCRAAAKVFQFGGMSYGGGDRTIFRKMMIKAPKAQLTYEHFLAAKARWIEAHPAYAIWRAAVEKEVSETRMVRNAFGRVRIFMDHPNAIKREAMNFRIQSAGACIINRAMIRLYDWLRANKMQSYFVLQIHDQLILECPESEAQAVADRLKAEIERPFVMHGIERSVRADSTIGDTYADV